MLVTDVGAFLIEDVYETTNLVTDIPNQLKCIVKMVMAMADFDLQI